MWPKQGLFGWKGFKRDNSFHSTAVILVILINLFLLMSFLDELFAPDSQGVLTLKQEFASDAFYLKGVFTILVCLVTSFFIRYSGKATRWGGRVLCCLLPASVIFIVMLQA